MFASVDEFGCIELLLGVHSHIDGAVCAEAKPSFWSIELRGTDAEIEQDAVERRPLRHDRSHVSEFSAYRNESVAKA